MATIKYERSEAEGKTTLVAWRRLGKNDVGESFSVAGARDYAVQVKCGPIGRVVLEGTLEKNVAGDDDWFTLKDPRGFELVCDYSHGETVSSGALYVRPRVSDGHKGTSVDVILLLGGSK